MTLCFLMPLVMLVVRVLQSMVLDVCLSVGGCWLVLGAGPRHSWQRGWWVALLVG